MVDERIRWLGHEEEKKKRLRYLGEQNKDDGKGNDNVTSEGDDEGSDRYPKLKGTPKALPSREKLGDETSKHEVEVA